jgi:protein O-GlcNAc transferase
MPPQPPSEIAQTIQRGLAFHRQGRLMEAEGSYRWVLARQADQFEALHLLGLVRMQQGDPSAALDLMSRALRIRPNATEVLSNLNVVLMALNRHGEALANLEKMIAAHPADVNALFNRGIALAALGRGEEAIASYDRALKIQPALVDALYNRAAALVSLERHEEALTSYEKVLSIAPRNVDALINRANVLFKLERFEGALDCYDRVLALQPGHLDALANRGAALKQLKGPEDALLCFEKALAINPNHVNSLVNRGNALLDLNRPYEALHSYDKAISIEPINIEALIGRGLGLFRYNRLDEAAAHYDRALSTNPRNVELLMGQGTVLIKLRRWDMALSSIRAGLAIEPENTDLLGALVNCLSETCDWAELEEPFAKINSLLAEGKPFDPLLYVRLTIDPAAQLVCARNYVRDKVGIMPEPLWKKRRGGSSGKIRVAYLSPDLRNHPAAYLIARLFELHDSTRFETIGISFGPDDGSEIRARIVRALDQFHDVRQHSDRDVADLLATLQADIVVDLAGHTDQARPRLLAMRAAPVQVGYLGFCSTVGGDYLDYIIADRIVLPFDQQPHYTEKIVHLPDCFMVTDATQVISPRTPTRAEAGLPEQGFVFCCFNGSYKFRAPCFDVWMRLMRTVDGSVLWLPASNPVMTENLRKEAAHRGVDPARIVFARPVERREDHFARARLADLFLDTLPYNAHSTACDSLYAGVPVLTCRGDTFAGSVAASLLHAVGLPQLVTNSLEEYEALALRLSTNAEELRLVRRSLAENLPTYPLFDNDRFRRHIEAAYTTMWEIHQRGEPPGNFRVPVLGPAGIELERSECRVNP